MINSYCKWRITVFEKTIKIGCKEKTTEEWDDFFENNETYETSTETREYGMIRSSFEMAKAVQKHFIFINKKKDLTM